MDERIARASGVDEPIMAESGIAVLSDDVAIRDGIRRNNLRFYPRRHMRAPDDLETSLSVMKDEGIDDATQSSW